MENFSYHVPFYVVTGGVATTGHSSDLTAGQVGLIDRQTWSVATPSGNGKEFFFAQGSIGGKDWYGQKLTDTHKSPFFLAKDIKNIYKSYPVKIQNEEWTIGYDGSASSVGLTFEKGKSTKVKFYFYGDPIYRKFAGPKEYVVSYSPSQDCVDDACDTSCGPDALDCRPHVSKMIDKINNHPELKNFGVIAKLKSDLFVAATPDMTKWSLNVCDNGDIIALQAVQSQYPGKSVTRIARAGSVSTYQFCAKTTLGTPAAFAQSGSVLLAVCGTCPSGSTLVASTDTYIVERPLAGTENLTTTIAQQTYATGIATAYSATSGKFLLQTGAVAKVELVFPTGTVVTALLSDSVTFGHTNPDNCSFAAPATIAWANVGTGISSVRTLKTKLARPNCDPNADRLTELTAFLTQFTDVNISSLAKIAGDACVDEYTVDQYSNDCLDEGCLTENVTFHYNTLPSIDSAVWDVVPAVPTVNTAAKCGIVITAGYIDPQFGNCSFNPFDYYNSEPIRMEVSLFNEGAGNCTYANLATVFKSRQGTIGRQSGEEIVREVVMKTGAYQKHMDQFSPNPRMREAFDQNLLSMVDRTAFYILYYVTFNANYNGLERKNEQEKFTAIFAIKESDVAQTSLESGPLSILQAKSGVNLHINS